MKTLFLLVSFAIAQIAFGQSVVLLDTPIIQKYEPLTPNGTTYAWALFDVQVQVTTFDWLLDDNSLSFSIYQNGVKIDAPLDVSYGIISGGVNVASFPGDPPHSFVQGSTIELAPVFVYFLGTDASGSRLSPGLYSIMLDSVTVTNESGSFALTPSGSISSMTAALEIDRSDLPVSAIPEPSTYAAIFGAAALAIAFWIRRKPSPTSSVFSAR